MRDAAGQLAERLEALALRELLERILGLAHVAAATLSSSSMRDCAIFALACASAALTASDSTMPVVSGLDDLAALDAARRRLQRVDRPRDATRDPGRADHPIASKASAPAGDGLDTERRRLLPNAARGTAITNAQP